MSSVQAATLRERIRFRIEKHPVIARAVASGGAGIATLAVHHAERFPEVPYSGSEILWGAGLGLATLFPALLGIRALRRTAPQVANIAVPEERIPQLLEEVEGLRRENSGLRAELEALRGKLTAQNLAQTEMAALRESLAEKDRALASAAQNTARLSRDVDSLRRSVEVEKGKLAAAEVSLRAQIDKIKELEKTLKILQETLERQEEALKASQEEAADLRRVIDTIRYARDPNQVVEIGRLGHGGMGITIKCYDPARQLFIVVKQLYDFTIVPLERLVQLFGSGFITAIQGVLAVRVGSSDAYEFIPDIRSAKDIERLVPDKKNRRLLVRLWEQVDALATDAKMRFENEQRALDHVQGPNVVRGYGRVGDRIAMELIRGRTLENEIIRESKIPLARALAVATQITRALKAFEAADIVHRDLKPENVMLVYGKGPEDEDWVKLIDLGAAKLPRGLAHETLHGNLAPFTLEYMPPERFTGSGDNRSDIWALGVILYKMLCGKVPFPYTGPQDIVSPSHQLDKISKESLPDIQNENPEIPPQMQALLGKMMAKKPGDRPSLDMLLAEFVAMV